MSWEKVILSLKGHERNILICILLYAFVAYTILFMSIEEFRAFDWYQEVILSVGASITILSLSSLCFLPSIVSNEIKYIEYHLLSLTLIISVLFIINIFLWKCPLWKLPFFFIVFGIVFAIHKQIDIYYKSKQLKKKEKEFQ